MNLNKATLFLLFGLKTGTLKQTAKGNHSGILNQAIEAASNLFLRSNSSEMAYPADAAPGGFRL